MKSPNNNSNILILEDDLDQMRLLVTLAQNEIIKITDDDSVNDTQKQRIKDVGIIKVSNTNSLEKAALIHKNVLLTVLDCNAPDNKGGVAHDQLVKTNHKITGQHHSVDIITKQLPDTPITLVSSLDRFSRTVNRYYENKYNLRINFIRKSDLSAIAKNFERHLREYLRSIG